MLLLGKILIPKPVTWPQTWHDLVSGPLGATTTPLPRAARPHVSPCVPRVPPGPALGLGVSNSWSFLLCVHPCQGQRHPSHGSCLGGPCRVTVPSSWLGWGTVCRGSTAGLPPSTGEDLTCHTSGHVGSFVVGALDNLPPPPPFLVHSLATVSVRLSLLLYAPSRK